MKLTLADLIWIFWVLFMYDLAKYIALEIIK